MRVQCRILPYTLEGSLVPLSFDSDSTATILKHLRLDLKGSWAKSASVAIFTSLRKTFISSFVYPSATNAIWIHLVVSAACWITLYGVISCSPMCLISMSEGATVCVNVALFHACYYINQL